MRRLVYAALLTGAAAVGAALVEWGAIEAAMAAAPRPMAKSATPAAARADAPRPDQASVPSQIVYLVRSTLGALQDANSTGNYSVLRDLAAPTFQTRHSTADLAEIFAPARRKPIDLAAAAVLLPVVSETTRPEANRLHITGHVGTDASKVAFALQFEAVNGHWRIAGLSVTPAMAQPAR